MTEGSGDAASEPDDAERIVTEQDFSNSRLCAFLDAYHGSDSYEFEDALLAEAKEAGEGGNEVDARVFSIVQGLMSCHLRVDDPAEPFGPRLVMDGRRSMIPADVSGAQNDVIAAVTATIPHPSVRARFGDIAFLNDRKKQYRAGLAAMNAYGEVVIGRLDGRLACRIPGLELGSHDVVEPLKRAFQLMRQLCKRGDVPGSMREAFGRAYAVSVDGAKYVQFVELAELGQSFGLLQAAEVASSAEALARAAPPDAYPEAVKRVWLHAATCHHWLDQADEMRRCQIEATVQTLKMRDQCNGSMAKAHWTKTAIGELRQVQGTADRISTLLDELRQLQMAAQDEMSVFSTTMDLDDERKDAVALFEEVTLPQAFVELIAMVQPPDVDELRRLVVEQAKESVLSSLMGASYHDEDGKEVARVEAAPLDGPPSEEWYKAGAVRFMEAHRLVLVRGRLEPGRRTLMDRFPIDERHVAPIAYQSPFVPPRHGPLFALGFARMFQGDYVSAAHILFPQLEAALRHVLVVSNRDPSKIDADLLQGDRTLSAMLDVNRADLQAVFGRDVVHEIDILFSFRPGPALRNELAHGKLSWAAFHQPETVIGCWLMFNLACRPLLRRWNERIAPEIEASL